MHNLAARVDLAVPDEVPSRRHRTVVSASFAEAAREDAQGAGEAIGQLSLLAHLEDALERIASTTTDAAARDLAEDTLALYRGR
jgi:hypothetical protein